MLKDILKEFDEKFTTNFNGKRILFYDFDEDQSLINPEYLKQFLSDKIKEAMDSVKLEHKTFPEKESDEFDAGYNFAVDQMNNNIKEFYETKN